MLSVDCRIRVHAAQGSRCILRLLFRMLNAPSSQTGCTVEVTLHKSIYSAQHLSSFFRMLIFLVNRKQFVHDFYRFLILRYGHSGTGLCGRSQ